MVGEMSAVFCFHPDHCLHILNKRLLMIVHFLVMKNHCLLLVQNSRTNHAKSGCDVLSTDFQLFQEEKQLEVRER